MSPGADAFIGIPSSGSAGLINLISRFATGHILAGVFCVLSTVGWALQGLAVLWMYKNVSLLSCFLGLRRLVGISSDLPSVRQVWAHSHGSFFFFLSLTLSRTLRGM